MHYTEAFGSSVKDSADAPLSHSDLGSANNTGNLKLRPGSILQLSTIKETAMSAAIPYYKNDTASAPPEIRSSVRQ